MPQIPDKQIRPEVAQTKCQHCQGSGQTKKADGSKQMCYYCRGAGVSGGNYMTK